MTRAEPQGETFGRVAEAYARARPSYPLDAFAAAIERWRGHDPLALDVAAGTGIATAGLLEVGASVVAVEPDPAMVRRARASQADRDRFLGAVRGRAEALPVADAAVDVVVAAQAFHWFEAAGALDEFARVLAPDGIVALVWNVVEPDAFVDAVRAWIADRAEDVEIPVTLARMEDPPPALVDHPAFERPRARSFPHEREMDAERYVAYAFSWSYLGGSLERAERGPAERELRALVDRHHGTEPWRERLVAVLHSAVRRG